MEQEIQQRPRYVYHEDVRSRQSRHQIQAETPAQRVARVFVHARKALGTEEEATLFMMSTHPELNGRRPVDLAETERGTQRIERLLTALEYGLAL